MAIEWTRDLEVGVEEIDNQHKELFRKINELLDACNQAKGREVVGKIIDFLGGYVVEHFQCEEKYMLKYNYPELKNHQAHHAQFIQNFGELKVKFETDGPGAHIVILANRVVVGWLNSHIRNVDRQMGTFLKTKI